MTIGIPWDLDCCHVHRTVLCLSFLDRSCKAEASHTVLILSAKDVDTLDVGTEADFHFKLAKPGVQI